MDRSLGFPNSSDKRLDHLDLLKMVQSSTHKATRSLEILSEHSENDDKSEEQCILMRLLTVGVDASLICFLKFFRCFSFPFKYFLVYSVSSCR